MNNAVLRSNNHSLRWCYVWNREKRKIEWTKYKIGSHLLRLSREIEGISPHWVGQYISLSDTAQPLNSEANETKTEFFGFLRHTQKGNTKRSRNSNLKCVLTHLHQYHNVVYVGIGVGKILKKKYMVLRSLESKQTP